MTDIFQIGRQFLDSLLDDNAIQPGVYIRYSEQTGVSLNLTPLSNANRTEDGEYFEQEYVVTDFGIRMDTIVTPGDISFSDWLADDPIRTGDIIQYNGGIFEVIPGESGVPFDWTSVYRTGVRVHTIYQGPTP